MFLCNAIGIFLLFAIAFVHLIGVEKEKHGDIIDTNVNAEGGIGSVEADNN